MSSSMPLAPNSVVTRYLHSASDMQGNAPTLLPE